MREGAAWQMFTQNVETTVALLGLHMYYWPSAERAASCRFCCPWKKATVDFWFLTKHRIPSKFA
jgi:hypothetical protein